MPVLTPGPLTYNTDPEFIGFGQEHNTEYRATTVHESQMNGVFTSALKKILCSIKRIQNPQPLRLQRLSFRELFLGRLFTQQGPAGIGESLGQPIEQPLVHREISCRNRAFPTVVHAESFWKSMGWLLTTGIGTQDVGRSPAETAQLGEQSFLADPGRQESWSWHHDQGRRWPL